MRYKKAFTMAEAVLVMTILGIIATIMITTLKPAEFKDKGMAILAKKVLSEIDTATTQILVNNSQNGTMSYLYVPDSSTTFSFANNANIASLGKLYKTYLTATRTTTTSNDCAQSGYNNSFFLKDGSCIAFKVGNQANAATRFPGETSNTSVTASHGLIFFDVNGADDPNVVGKDRFILPINNGGIMYATD